MTIRIATPDDASALLALYAPYVQNTTITFEYAVPTLEEFRTRIAHTLHTYPYLVAQDGGHIIGYAYASEFKARAAYSWAVETSIYVDMQCQRKGCGTALYAKLESYLTQQHVTNVNACITYPNPQSIAFHEKHGYRTVAHFTKCGYKNGWCDMIWMEKFIAEHGERPKEFIPFAYLEAPCQ